jgi:transposase
MARKKTKSYPESFRREAVRLADQPDRTATDVAKELGIHVGQIYNWRTQFNKLSKGQFTVADGTNYSKQEIAEIRRLKKEVAELKEERDFLKKATAYFAKTDK